MDVNDDVDNDNDEDPGLWLALMSVVGVSDGWTQT